MFFQFILIAVVIGLATGRIIGTQISFVKKIIATIAGVTVSSAAYWFMYLRYQDFSKIGIDTYFWLGSTLLASMLFYLIFEMFDPKKQENNGDMIVTIRNPLSKFLYKIKRHKRFMRVVFIAIKHGVGRNLTTKRSNETDSLLAASLRNTLEECGGIFIKFGQVLSTRSDILPHSFIVELSNLQENVTNLTYEQVEVIINNELNTPLNETFSYFDFEPLAAASIGQVHKARLKKGDQEVVVKLLRPNISETITSDLDILIHFAAWISNKSEWARKIGFLDLAKGFSIAMKEEINFKIEARNFEQISSAMKSSKSGVRIPEVYHEISNSKILVIEYLDGVSVKNGLSILNELQIDAKVIQQQLFDCIAEQIFFKGIFHADPHPGNVYILKDGTPALLDFGSVGRLAAIQREAFKRLLVGFDNKNSYVLLDGLLQLVEPKQALNKEGLEQAISQLLIQTDYTAKSSSEELMQGLFQIISDFELSFYPMVAGAFRSLITLEGTMLQLNPKFNIIDEARRYAKTYSKDFMPISSPEKLKETVTNELLALMPMMKRIPRRMDDISSKLEQGELSVKIGFFSDKTNASFVSMVISQFLLAFIGTAFGIISIGLLYVSTNQSKENGTFFNVSGYIGLFISAIILIRVAIQAVRRFK